MYVCGCASGEERECVGPPLSIVLVSEACTNGCSSFGFFAGCCCDSYEGTSCVVEDANCVAEEGAAVVGAA